MKQEKYLLGMTLAEIAKRLNCLSFQSLRPNKLHRIYVKRVTEIDEMTISLFATAIY